MYTIHIYRHFIRRCSVYVYGYWRQHSLSGLLPPKSITIHLCALGITNAYKIRAPNFGWALIQVTCIFLLLFQQILAITNYLLLSLCAVSTSINQSIKLHEHVPKHGGCSYTIHSIQLT